MLGYVRPYKPELKIKDFASYKAVYCGLCNALGKNYSPLSRFILSYDATFFCMLHMSVDAGACQGYAQKRCPFNPLKKCAVCMDSDKLNFWAAASIILGYYKLKDDMEDSGALKKIRAAIFLPAFKLMRKKAARIYPFIENCAARYIKAQREVEQKNGFVPDEAAEPTAIMMRDLFAELSNDVKQRRILSHIGYFTGRWIYFTDAVDDLEHDYKYGDYNPFLRFQNDDSKAPDFDAVKKQAGMLLNSCVYEMTSAFELLEAYRYKPVIGNVFYLGLTNIQKMVISGAELPKI